MKLYEFEIPGGNLAADTPDAARNLWQLFSQMTDAFFSATAALHLFEQSQATHPGPVPPPNIRRIIELESQILAKHQGSAPPSRLLARYLAEIEHKKERWAGGEVPSSIAVTRVFIHARAFIFALDEFASCLKELSGKSAIDGRLQGPVAEMQRAFPDLREIRNSAHHMEQRAQLVAFARPITPVPTAIGVVHYEGACLGNLHDDVYVMTLRNGQIGQLPINDETMRSVQQILQAAINSIEWTGGTPHHFPRW